MSIELNRSAFEAFAQRNEFGTYRTDRKGDGYDSSHTQLMWMAWCAAIQQAESEPVARVELMQTGGNAGLATRIVEIYDPLRERLLPGDVLYTHPSPGVQDDVVRDAERYRWLKDRNNKAQTGVGRWESDDHFTWLCDLDADEAIDAAMLTAAQAQKGQP